MRRSFVHDIDMNIVHPSTKVEHRGGSENVVDIDHQKPAKVAVGLEKLKLVKLRNQDFRKRFLLGLGAEENSLRVCDVASESAGFSCGFA